MVSDFSQKRLELVIGSADEEYGSVQSFKIVTNTDLEKHKISIQVPCEYLISTYDDFPYKREIFETLNLIPESKLDAEVYTMTALALRLLISETLKLPNPLGYQDNQFEDMYLSYLASLEFDDFAHWTEEDFQYYNQVCFSLNIEALNRKRVYKQLREAMYQVDMKLHNDVFILENYDRFN